MTKEDLKHSPHNNSNSEPLTLVSQHASKVLRLVLACFGGVLIVIGVPLAILTPFPFVPIGLPVVILGVVLLARNSTRGRGWIQGLIEKHPMLKRFASKSLLNLIFGKQDKTT